MNAHGRKFFQRILLLTLVILPVLCCCILPVGTVIGLGVFKESDNDMYDEKVGSLVGVGSRSIYSLSPEDVQKVIDAGFEPTVVANSVAAIQWIEESLGVNIDLGIMLAIYSHESGKGSNMGTCDGLQAAQSNPNTNPVHEKAAALWLLDHFKEFNIKAQNPAADQFVWDGYANYTGHCSAGEMGMDGILPTTGKKICAEGLSTHEDSEIQSCDFWSTKVSPHAKSWWLQEIGYNAELDDEAKVNKLYGWNHDLGYRQTLVADAAEINALLGDLQVVSTDSTVVYGDMEAWMRQEMLQFMADYDLLPEGTTYSPAFTGDWLAIPMRSNNGMTQDWGGYNGHLGIDWGCAEGTEILAVAPGYVVNPNRWVYKYDPLGWGWIIWIDHGNGIYSSYFHLGKLHVNYGQHVSQGEVIGTCGSTGNSTGPHLHFAVSTKHPDKFVTWNDTQPGWDNPHKYLPKTTSQVHGR